MRRVLLRVGVLALGAAGIAVAAGCGQQATRPDDNLVNGKQLFVSKCGSCHTLARAGTKGTVGPNLDDAFRQALHDGLGRSTVRGVVEHQILYPYNLKNQTTGTQMPAKLVKGDSASDVAAYVAISSASPGKDAGLLATAVKAPGAGKPIAEQSGVLQIDADPTGQLAYVSNKATGTPGPVTFRMQNKSSVPHDLVVQGPGVDGKTPIGQGGATGEFKASLKAGSYTYFCSVDGHRQAGMQGTLTVR
jgi:mono/diheme cytochrome c family protein